MRFVRAVACAVIVCVCACAEGGASGGAGSGGPASATAGSRGGAIRAATPASGEAVAARLACGACHADMPGLGAQPGRSFAPGSVDADSVFGMLRDPSGVHDFHLDDAEALALAVFLGGEPASRSLRRLRDDHEEIDEASGRRIFVALNCAGCHPVEGIDGRPLAPALTFEGSRVRAEWLRRFLLDPSAIRPYGPAGSAGMRMPDLHMSDRDADSLVAYLMGRTVALPAFEPDSLTAFEREKAASLFDSRFSCRGCHAWSGRGGRIGPDLASAGARLDPAWIRAMLESPAHLVPGTVMPPMDAPAGMEDLIASWVAMNGVAPARDTVRAGYLSLIENPPSSGDTAPRTDYGRYCAACHGVTGEGDGWNARFLSVRPADHTDAAAMAARPDDVLYDGIAAGARFLDRSPEMPGFSDVLEPAVIRGLVAHIRTLCACEGPAWSRDGSRQ